MSKKTHKLRGVTLKCTKHKFEYPMDRSRITDALSLYQADAKSLPENFNSMHEHDKLHALALCGVRHTPRYT